MPLACPLRWLGRCLVAVGRAVVLLLLLLLQLLLLLEMLLDLRRGSLDRLATFLDPVEDTLEVLVVLQQSDKL